MSRVKTAMLAILVSVGVPGIAVTGAEAGDRYWYADIQRDLGVAERCPRPHEITASRLPPLPEPDRAVNMYSTPRHAVRRTQDEGYDERYHEASYDVEVSCIQGTHIVREQGFRHVEVVTCNGDGYYVYEALRGRQPWRLNVSVLDGDIVRAFPLN